MSSQASRSVVMMAFEAAFASDPDIDEFGVVFDEDAAPDDTSGPAFEGDDGHVEGEVRHASRLNSAA
jgi:hypothetical protein